MKRLDEIKHIRLNSLVGSCSGFYAHQILLWISQNQYIKEDSEISAGHGILPSGSFHIHLWTLEKIPLNLSSMWDFGCCSLYTPLILGAHLLAES